MHISFFFPTDTGGTSLEGLHKGPLQKGLHEGPLYSSYAKLPKPYTEGFAKPILQKGLCTEASPSPYGERLCSHIHTHIHISVFFPTDTGGYFTRGASQRPSVEGASRMSSLQGLCKTSMQSLLSPYREALQSPFGGFAQGICKAPIDRVFMTALCRRDFTMPLGALYPHTHRYAHLGLFLQMGGASLWRFAKPLYRRGFTKIMGAFLSGFMKHPLQRGFAVDEAPTERRFVKCPQQIPLSVGALSIAKSFYRRGFMKPHWKAPQKFCEAHSIEGLCEASIVKHPQYLQEKRSKCAYVCMYVCTKPLLQELHEAPRKDFAKPLSIGVL